MPIVLALPHGWHRNMFKVSTFEHSFISHYTSITLLGTLIMWTKHYKSYESVIMSGWTQSLIGLFPKTGSLSINLPIFLNTLFSQEWQVYWNKLNFRLLLKQTGLWQVWGMILPLILVPPSQYKEETTDLLIVHCLSRMGEGGKWSLIWWQVQGADWPKLMDAAKTARQLYSSTVVIAKLDWVV